MATFTAGTSFTDGVTGDVTAAKLNALVANATPLSNLITDRTAETSIATDDLVLISDTSESGALNKMTVANLMKAEMTGTINSTAGTITTGVIPTLTSTTLITSGTGTASAPAIVPTGDTNTGIFFPAADTIAFSDGGTEAMRIDSSGNVGIGTSSPAGKLNVVADSALAGNFSSNSGTSEQAISTFSNPTNGGYLSIFGIGSSSSVNSWGNGSIVSEAVPFSSGNYIIGSYTGNLIFQTNNRTERLRITSGGEVYIAGTTDQGAYNLQVNGTGVWGAGAYVNGSDERLKENIQDITSGLDVVEKLRPVSFQYKEEYTADRSIQSGFIAQDLLVALEGKNYLEGVVSQGPTYYNVAYQNLIPILAKAIQELKAENDSLKTRIAALEAA